MAASSWREPAPAVKLVDVRCKACGRLLCRTDGASGRIEIVCPAARCKRYQQHRLQESKR